CGAGRGKPGATPGTRASRVASTSTPSWLASAAAVVGKLRRMPQNASWPELASRLTDALHLAAAPLAITFSAEAPAGVAPFDDPMPEPTADGRTGRVPAGCVFWMKAADRTFSTVADDHANCSVGSVTHGFK